MEDKVEIGIYTCPCHWAHTSKCSTQQWLGVILQNRIMQKCWDALS